MSKSKGSVSLGTDALAILYDTNGFKSPNQQNKDLRTINVLSLGKYCGGIKIGKTCFASSASNTYAHTWKACNDNGKSENPEDKAFMDNYELELCSLTYATNDYFAGAAEICNGVSKIPTKSQLADLANYIYGIDGIGDDTTKDAPIKLERATSLGLKYAYQSYFILISRDNYSKYGYTYRAFGPNNTHTDTTSRNNSQPQVICLGDFS